MTTGGIADAAALDVFAFDPRRGAVLLVMEEPRPWNGGDEQLHQLQEKFNDAAAYFHTFATFTALHSPEITRLRRGKLPLSGRTSGGNSLSSMRKTIGD